MAKLIAKTGTIYIITNNVNDKAYIGKTVRKLTSRWNAHVRAAIKGRDTLIYNAVRKHGSENFVCKVLMKDVPVEILNEAEVNAIHLWNSKSPNGYNLTDGGDGISNITKRTRVKMSKAAKGNSSHKGFKHGSDTRLKMSVGHWSKNSILEAGTRKKMRDGSWARNPEFRIIVADKIRNRFKKPIEQFTTDMVSLNKFSGASEAGKLTKINVLHICSCANLKCESAGGFIWRYL